MDSLYILKKMRQQSVIHRRLADAKIRQGLSISSRVAAHLAAEAGPAGTLN